MVPRTSMLTIKNQNGRIAGRQRDPAARTPIRSGRIGDRRSIPAACLRAVPRCARISPWVALMILLAGCTPPGPRALLEGKRLIDQGHYAEAVERLKQATTLMNTNAQAWNTLGLACHLDGQLTNAAQAYERALALNRDLIEAHYNLGCLCMEEGRLDQARSELTTFTSIRRNSADGWTKLGAVELREAEQERRSGRTGAPTARALDLAAAEHSFTECSHL